MWWICRKGTIEGPYDEAQIIKRIKLNVLRSLDSISEDKINWVYVKDSKFWYSGVESTIQTPTIRNQRDNIVTPKVKEANLNKNQAVTSTETKSLYIKNENTNRTVPFILKISGIVVLVISLLIGLFWLISSESNNKKEITNVAFHDIKNKVVIINSNQSSGTGFLLEIDNKVYLISNEHVLRSSETPIAQLINGEELQLGEFSVASDGRDIARFEVLNYNGEMFQLDNEIPDINDEVVVYGNSLGGGVATELKGKIVGVGPRVLEIDNEIVPGNSGSPIISTNGKVLGIASYLSPEGFSNEWTLKDTKFENKVRRFALRFTKLKWISVNRKQYEKQIKEKELYEYYLNMLYPFLMYTRTESEIPEQHFLISEYQVKNLRHKKFAYDQILIELSQNYKTMKGLYNQYCNIQQYINNETISLEQKNQYYQNLEQIERQIFQENIKFLNNQKTALAIGNQFLNQFDSDAPQLLYGYEKGDTEGVLFYKEILDNFSELINEDLVNLNQGN